MVCGVVPSALLAAFMLRLAVHVVCSWFIGVLASACVHSLVCLRTFARVIVLALALLALVPLLVRIVVLLVLLALLFWFRFPPLLSRTLRARTMPVWGWPGLGNGHAHGVIDGSARRSWVTYLLEARRLGP